MKIIWHCIIPPKRSSIINRFDHIRLAENDSAANFTIYWTPRKTKIYWSVKVIVMNKYNILPHPYTFYLSYRKYINLFPLRDQVNAQFSFSCIYSCILKESWWKVAGKYSLLAWERCEVSDEYWRVRFYDGKILIIHSFLIPRKYGIICSCEILAETELRK